jgi:hypothetical protein
MTPSAHGIQLHMTKRSVLFAGLAAFVFAALAMTHAYAHHSWASYDTRYAYYIAGAITEVRWGNPHVAVRVRIENTTIPPGWTQRSLPPGADAQDGEDTMLSARPYTGEYNELELTLAPPDWMDRWGLHRRLEEGERIEAVGFLTVKGGDEFRPVMFWLADGQGVWQKLLPFPHRPEPARPLSAH